MINPELTLRSVGRFQVWDDCMCFPNLLVKVYRHIACKVNFRDLNWKETEVLFENDLSELFQHEYDHLDGILATSRAIDGQSFMLLQ
jgi:peptide deformylase